MRNRLTSLVFLGAACGLSIASFAAEQPGSYAADGRCYCNLPIRASLDGEIISTPIGGQSLAQVCKRIGEGPGLEKSGSGYNFPIYNDMQCGHGPGLTGFSALMRDAGMKIDALGPEWDLEAAYLTAVSDTPSGKSQPVTKQPVYKQAAGSANEKTSKGVDAQSSVASAHALVNASEALRLKSRYVQPLEAGLRASDKSTVAKANVSSAKTSSTTNSASVTSEAAGASRPRINNALANGASTQVPAQEPSTQTEEQRRLIESLPLAKLYPLEGAGVEGDDIDAQASAEEAVSNETVQEAQTLSQSDAELISEPAEAVTASTAQPSATETTSTETSAVPALRIPSSLSGQSRQFEYLSVMPMGYDFGGAGVQLAASALHNNSTRLLARAGFAEDYQEVLLGAGYLLPVGRSERLSIGVMGGVEFGRFDLQAGGFPTSSSSTGVFARATTVYEVSRQIELQGGVGYSSFFEGDPHVFGAALFHATRKLDFIGEFEAGDNDSAGIGIRYHYR